MILHDSIPLPENISPLVSSFIAPVDVNCCEWTEIMGWREKTHNPLPMMPLMEVCECVCVCVRERERERERVCVCECVDNGERE